MPVILPEQHHAAESVVASHPANKMRMWEIFSAYKQPEE
jgi:hypothetical protein